MSERTIAQLVERFLSWPLPLDVASDLCVTITDSGNRYNRVGTNLLTASQAEAMIRYLLEPVETRCESCNQTLVDTDDWCDSCEEAYWAAVDAREVEGVLGEDTF